MKKIRIAGLFCAISYLLSACSSTPKCEFTYVKEIENCNYHQVATWFAYPELLEHYQEQLETILEHSMFDVLVFSKRSTTDMLDSNKMFPMYHYVTKRAAEKNVWVGMQYPWTHGKLHREGELQSLIFEGEGELDAFGDGEVVIRAFGPRNAAPLKAQLYRAYSFNKRGDDAYEPGSLREITHLTTLTLEHDGTARATINGPGFIGGRTVFVMAEFVYNSPSMYGGLEHFLGDVIATNGDIPFRAAMLDEFTFLKLVPPWGMKPGEEYRGRYFSAQMDSAFHALYGVDMSETMLAMRYTAERQVQKKMQAINRFMAFTRDGAVQAQNSYYDQTKAAYGQEAWLGSHSTYHNELGGDEITCTGAIWWSAKRDYGQTDEWTPLATQMGVLYAYPSKIMYNMFYDPSKEIFFEKVLTDLRYNIRTNYHAINDYHNQWGVTFDTPEQLEETKTYERVARLLNRFDPEPPRVDVLVIFGMEALCNWYPDSTQRTQYDIRKLVIEDKVVELEQAGYLTALVPSDLIRDGILTLSANNKPIMNGREFESIIFLYPEYSREGTITFLERYVAAGGKLMLEGALNYDFNGIYVGDRFEALQKKAVATQYTVGNMPLLGATKNVIQSGSQSTDGSVIFTNYVSLRDNLTTTFSIELGDDTYTGTYRGMVAFQPVKGRIVKLASAGLLSLEKNGETLLAFDHPVQLYVEQKEGVYNFLVIDPKGLEPIPKVNRL